MFHRSTPSENCSRLDGYWPVNRIATHATIVVNAHAMLRKQSAIRCGMMRRSLNATENLSRDASPGLRMFYDDVYGLDAELERSLPCGSSLIGRC